MWYIIDILAYIALFAATVKIIAKAAARYLMRKGSFDNITLRYVLTGKEITHVLAVTPKDTLLHITDVNAKGFSKTDEAILKQIKRNINDN